MWFAVIGLRYIEWFSIDCRRTKAKVISVGSIFASFSSTVYVPPRVSRTAAGNRAYVFTAVKTTGHARDLSTSSNFPFHHTKFPRSTSATRAISVLSLIILPLQTFVSRVLLLRQLAFSSENLPPERPTTTTTRIKAQDFMFRYERINST